MTDQEKPQVIGDTSAYPKLPIPLMTDTGIENYFMSLEYWFLACGVTNDTRQFHTVMAQVPPSKLPELKSVLEELPNDNQYLYNKQKLIAHFADSQQRRLQRLLSDLPLGDMRPSQLFHEMTRVAGSAVQPTVIRDLWATRLPAHAQAAVVASKGTDAEVTRIADAIVESMQLRSVNLLEENSREAPTSDRDAINLLREEIAQLTRRLDDSSWARRRSSSRSGRLSHGRSSSRRRYDTPVRQTRDQPECWYHRTYGSLARSCRSPCRFKRNTTSAPPASY